MKPKQRIPIDPFALLSSFRVSTTSRYVAKSLGNPGCLLLKMILPMKCFEFFIPLEGVEPTDPMEFLQANGTQAQRTVIRLFKGIASVHDTSIVCTVCQPKDVTDLVDEHLAAPPKGNGAAFSRFFFSPEPGKIAHHAKDSDPVR